MHLCTQGIAPLKSPAEAISECPASGNDTADLPCWCSPQFQVAAVTANEVARMGINLWMLGAVVFLASFLSPALNLSQQHASKTVLQCIICLLCVQKASNFR